MAQSSGSPPPNGRSSAPRRAGLVGDDLDPGPEPELDESTPAPTRLVIEGPEPDLDDPGPSYPHGELDDDEPPPEVSPFDPDPPSPPRTRGNPSGRVRHSTVTAAENLAARVPPHDLAAESALLGAMLLSSAAAELGSTTLDAGDFYKPAHGHIFEAIRRLWLDGQPVDPVTVWDELGELGFASSITDGPSVLVTLLAETPATSSAARYAEIVERTSRQRKLIAWSNDLAEVAYRGTEWHEHLGRVLDLGNRNGVVHSPSTIEVADLAAILAGTDTPERPLWLTRTDGAALLYPGRIHDVHAAPSVGKTWVAALAIRQTLEMGGSALVVDYEDTARNLLERLRAIGADLEAVGDPGRFRYVKPIGAFGLAERAHVEKILGELEPDLVVLDGVAESIAQNGFDEISNTEVLRWRDAVVNPLRSGGAAVLMLDHVKKNTEDKSRGARGAGAKLGAIDGASFELILTRAYSRHRAGLIRLKIAKDRNGHVGSIGEIVADLHVRPSAGGLVVALDLDAPATDEPHKLTGLMQTLSRRLEGASGPLAQFAVFAGLGTEKRHLDRALADLVADGYAEAISGSGSTLTFRSVRPYREPDDDEGPAGRNPTEGDDPTGPSGPDANPSDEIPLF